MKSRRVKRSKRSKSKRKKIKRRSNVRTRVSLSKSRRSNKKRPRKIRVRKSSSKKAKTPKSSYKKATPLIPEIHARKVYLTDTKGISKNYPEVLVAKYSFRDFDSGLTFQDLCIHYPKTTGVYPNHPYIQTHGAIYTSYNYGWAWGSAFSIQSKDRIAIYSNLYPRISLKPPLEEDEDEMRQHEETSYKCVHYGKQSSLIDIGNGRYYRISVQGVSELFEPGYQITHFFSDKNNKAHCNVFWITSEGDLYIEYDTMYSNYGDVILAGYFEENDRKISPPIRIPEIQNPVLREQFLLKLLTMRQTQVTTFLRNILDRTLVEHGIIDTMPRPFHISRPIEKDPLSLRLAYQ